MTGGHNFQRHPTEDAIICVGCGKKILGASLQLLFGTCAPPLSDERKQIVAALSQAAGDPTSDPFRHMVLANVANWLLGKQALIPAAAPPQQQPNG